MNSARSIFADFTQTIAGEMDLCPTAFFRPGTRERELLNNEAATCLEYADSTIAVLRTRHGEWATRWCFGVAPNRKQSVIGIPIPDIEAGGPDGREAVLETLDLGSWRCWMPGVNDCVDQLRPGVQRRLQGGAGICWVPDDDFATVYADLVGEGPVKEAFRPLSGTILIEIGDQTIKMEECGSELARRDALARRCDRTQDVTLRFEEPAEVTVTGDGYNRRSVTLDPGVYFLSALGALSDPPGEQQAHTVPIFSNFQ